MKDPPKHSVRAISAPLLETQRLEPGCFRCSTFRNVTITVWFGQATLKAAESIIALSKRMSELYPDGRSSVTYVLNGLPAPTPEAQQVLSRIYESRYQIACSAVILEGTGFWASGLRSMINNNHREAAGGVPLRIATTAEAVVGWLAEEHYKRTGVEILPMQLLDMLGAERREAERVSQL